MSTFTTQTCGAVGCPGGPGVGRKATKEEQEKGLPPKVCEGPTCILWRWYDRAWMVFHLPEEKRKELEAKGIAPERMAEHSIMIEDEAKRPEARPRHAYCGLASKPEWL